MKKKSTYLKAGNSFIYFKSLCLLLLGILGSIQMPAIAASQALYSKMAVKKGEIVVRETAAAIRFISLNINTAPAFVTKQYNFSISERAAPGTRIGNVEATDAEGEKVVYAITAGNTNQAFALDATAGSITLSKRLNHHTQNSYQLTVKVTDAAGLTDEATVTITVAEAAESPTISKISWSSAASQPYIFYEGQGETVNGKWYTFSGFDSRKAGFTPTDRAYVFDPEANTWTPIAPMPPMNGTNYGGVTHAGFATDETDIYFAGGYTSNASGKGQIFGTKEVWKYIVAENRYERLPDLPIAVSAGQLEYLNGKLHHIASTDRKAKVDLGNHYVLDLDNPGAGWETRASLPQPRQHAGSAVYKGKIYFIGGQTGHDENSVTTSLVHVYNPETDSWSPAANFPAPAETPGISHIMSSVLVLGNQIIVLGGEYKFQKGTRVVASYSPATNTWSNLTSLPLIMRGGVGALLGGKIYYTGGKKVKATYAGIPLTNQKVTRLTLVNADNGEDIRLIGKVATVNLANLPSGNVSIRATTNPDTVGSVVFKLNGSQTHTQTESQLPYALFGGSMDKYTAWTPTPGEYTLAVTPYSDAGGVGVPGSTFQVKLTVIDSPLVANLTSHTGRSYVLGKLRPGVSVYTDRPYLVTAVPDFLLHAAFIKTPNDDKFNTTSGVFSFDLKRNATLYVAYDPRATALPAWLSGWQKLPDQVSVDDPKNNSLTLFSKSFPAGVVNFDGNRASPAAGALTNYIIIIKEQSGSKIITSTNALTEEVSEKKDALKLQVYPNPQKQGEKIFVVLENFGKKEKVAVVLHDIAGHKLLTQTVMTDEQGRGQAQIPVAKSVNPGVYLLKAQAVSGNQQVKLIIQ